MPMYPEIMVIPMREELTRLGIEELRTAEEVDQALKNRPGTTMVVVNSICGCAAGRMRPAVRMAMQNSVRPDHAYSVFAGQEKEATDRARSYFTGQMPSSPSIGILRDGQLVYLMPRSDIERREAPAIAADLKAAFDQLCQSTCQSEERSDEEPAFCRRTQQQVPRFARNDNPFVEHYFLVPSVIINALTTIAFGCIPTGIRVSSEYSVGSSFRGLRFWMTVTSPDCVSSTSR